MEIIIADFYTKFLQGNCFRLFQGIILNINYEDVQNILCSKKLTLKEGPKNGERATNDLSLQECVEGNDKTVKKY